MTKPNILKECFTFHYQKKERLPTYNAQLNIYKLHYNLLFFRYIEITSMSREGALWIGGLEQYMDEAFIQTALRVMGEAPPLSIKVIPGPQRADLNHPFLLDHATTTGDEK